MMSLSISPSDVAGPWRFENGAWSCGASFVRPFAHAVVESFAIEAVDSTLIVVRENPRARREGGNPCRAAGGTAAAQMERLLDWPLNVQIVSLARTGRRVTVAAGHFVTVPLFLTEEGGRLSGDWDVARLYPLLPFALDRGRAAYALCHLALPYGRQTIFPSVRQLTERARARWEPDRAIELAYPPGRPRPRPRRLGSEADVHSTFEALFAAIIRRSVGPTTDAPIATELSGGLDSGIATIVSARALSPERVRSFGLLLPGPQRPAQADRRLAVAAAAGVADVAIEAAGPFSRGLAADQDQVIPWGEFYREAFADVAGAMAEAGCSIIVRGIGGDEISELNEDEEDPAAGESEEDLEAAVPPYLSDGAVRAAEHAHEALEPAPQAYAEASFYHAAAAGVPVYLRRGIWPVYPYGAPEMVAFCRSLPHEWRADRRLQRSYLAGLGLPEGVVRPNPPENFLPLRDMMFEGASADRVRTLFAAPLLAELGLADAGRLQATFERAAADPGAPGRTHLLQAATVETMLRGWRRTSAPMGP